MRVVQVIDSLGLGGAQRLLVTFASAAQDVDLTIINLKEQNNNASFDQELQALGAQLVRIDSNKLLDLKRIRKMAAFLRAGKFDIIHTHLTYAHILGALTGRLASIPVVATLHNTRHNKEVSSLERVETTALQMGMKRIIAVGHVVADANRSRLPRRSLDIIPNAVSPIPAISADERRLARRELAGDADRPLFISVGRLHEQKGFDDLIDAFAKVHARYPQAALAIVGGGVLDKALEAQIDALGLKNDVRLVGRRNDVPRLLAASDIFVSASLWEGLPIAVLEGMSAGLPVVATAVGDVPKVIVDGTGFVVEPKRPDQLAEAMVTFLDNPAKIETIGQAAQAHTQAHYSPTVWANKITDLYQEVICPH